MPLQQWPLLAVALILAAGCSNPPDQKETNHLVLKVSHQWAQGDIRDQMARAFGDLVAERTQGTVEFRYYPARSLLKPKEQWDALRQGSLDMAVLPLDYASGKVPELSITLMPCTIKSLEQGLAWRHRPIGEKVETALLERGVRNLVWAWFDGAIGSKKRQIKVPADVQGTKLRAAGKKFELMMQAAGASITSMPSSETYHALSTDVIDTMLTSSASFVSFRLHEVLNYLNVPRDRSIWYMAENLLIGEKTWQRLTPEQRRVFLEAAEEMHEQWIVPHLEPQVDKLIEEYTRAGIDIHYMTDEEFNAWVEHARRTAWPEFAASVEGGQELLDLALAAQQAESAAAPTP